MKKMFFVAVTVLAVMFVWGRVDAFEISGVVVDGDQIVLQTIYGGNLSLEKGQNATPLIIELHLDGRFASVRELLNKKPKFLANFSKDDDFRTFAAFLRRTGDEVGSCAASIFGRDLCVVYVFF